MNKFLGHFKTVVIHKWRVLKLCFRLGLYTQGLLHDLSKFQWVEFSVGVKFFQGNRSPIDREKEVKGYSQGWLHHKGHNKHHWEYWLDFDKDKKLRGMPMPKRYIAEMFCDRVAASQTYLKDQYLNRSPLDYYLNGKDYMIMHENTAQTIEQWLTILADYGLDKTIQMIKEELKKD